MAIFCCQIYQAYCEYKRRKVIPNSAAVAVDPDSSLVRDGVRQEANLTLEQDGLTTTQDSVMPDEVSLTSSDTTFSWSQPTLEQALSRWYKINDTTWSYLTSQDTLILTRDISKDLFNITTLFDRVKRYRYWRAGVKVRLQVNSTPFHYGSLFACIVPSYNAVEAASPGNAIDNTVWGLSGQACCGFLSANTGKPLELSCPFQSPYEYLDITKLDGQRPFYLMVTVMNPLKVAGGATNPTLNLSLFAQFTDLQILAPSEITANSSSKKISKADKEQKNANKQGTLGKVAGAVSDVASKLTAIPVVGSIASAVAPIASAVGGIFDFFGWDKPTNISSQVMTIERPGRGLTHGSGQDPSETLALKPDQKVSTEASIYGYDDLATRSFLKLLQTPMWNNSFIIANNQVISNVFKTLWVRPYAPDITDVPALETQHHDYMSYYSQLFKACRGGYRYILHFDTSSYTTARVRITFEPSNTAVASITDGGDSFSRIVDVNGATTICLEVPYCYPSARMPIVQSVTSGAPANGQLLFSLVNPIQTNGSSSDVIYVNIFRCAADDFRFYQPTLFKQTRINPPALAVNSRYSPNSLILQLNSGPTATLGDGPKVLFDRITEDEEIMSHNDFLHRYRKAQDTAAQTCRLYPTSGDSYYWMYCFRAYRGATRHLVEGVGDNVDGLSLGSPDVTTVITNGAYVYPERCPVEIPYNNNVRFLPLRLIETTYLDAYTRELFSSPVAVQNHLWAAGDDFTLGLRRSPPAQGIA
jgi:hypothetical protein